MDQEHHKIKAENGKSYLLETSRENSLKAGLNGWRAMQLFELLKQARPERFTQMVTEGSIIPFLNSLVEQYHLNMETHLQNGWMETEANEVEWWNLAVNAGIEQGPLKYLPETPPR